MAILEICWNEIGGDSTVIAALPGMFTLARHKVTPVMFRSHSYIDKLNRTLQSEMRTLSAYHGIREQELKSPFGPTQADHEEASKQLVNLIISNQGIPDDEVSIGSGLAKTVVGICSSIPSKFFEQAAVKALAQMERGLCVSYEELLEQAPARDISTLKHLHYCAKSHIEDLQKLP